MSDASDRYKMVPEDSQGWQAREADGTILDEAKKIVFGARRAYYGTPAENHGRTAKFWAAYLGVPITAEQVCVLNILQKISRSMNTMTRDTLVDIAGYAENIRLCNEYPSEQAVRAQEKPVPAELVQTELVTPSEEMRPEELREGYQPRAGSKRPELPENFTSAVLPSCLQS